MSGYLDNLSIMKAKERNSGNPTITIGVAMHKPFDFPSETMYKALEVGAALHPQINKEAIQDDTGDNISALNPYFSELTGLYWLWKNCDSDYKGLVHYRRHFAPSSFIKRRFLPRRERYIRHDDLLKKLKQTPIILPTKRHYVIETIYSHYFHTLPIEQLETAHNVLIDMSPESVPAWDQVMQSRSAHLFNMMIMDREDFDAYCAWLFPILFELTSRLDPARYDDFNARYPGRISELLMDTWLITNNKKYGELPRTSPTMENWFRKGYGFLRAKFTGKKYTHSF